MLRIFIARVGSSVISNPVAEAVDGKAFGGLG